MGTSRAEWTLMRARTAQRASTSHSITGMKVRLEVSRGRKNLPGAQERSGALSNTNGPGVVRLAAALGPIGNSVTNPQSRALVQA